MKRFAILVLVIPALACGGEVLDSAMHHLRHGVGREWDEFAERAEGDHLSLTFESRANAGERALRVVHRDLRHVWRVVLNGKVLAKLPQDDNAMESVIAVPAGALRDGTNKLLIDCSEKEAEVDDVEVGKIELFDRGPADLLSEGAIDVSVSDTATHEAIPCRLTVVDSDGVLAGLGMESTKVQAVRTGVVYTASGRAALHLRAGKYTIYAGRGFEWGVDSVSVEVGRGGHEVTRLAIGREVDTRGFVASDTHIHTFTYSRHGDATLDERMVTLAGEGIELPIATDHNLTVDYEEAAGRAGVRQFFTPVVGNEVTTEKLGHFNVFPLDAKGRLINFRARTWEKLFGDIEAVAPGANVILNHARDEHGGFRPFDPRRHLSITGEDLEGWRLRASAMEVINSGATLSDPRMLFRDWMGCLNRGMRLTPVGASDSHDVSRFIVGQGRTYIRVKDDEAGKIDVAAACAAFGRGEVMVSDGLLAELTVNQRFSSGSLARIDEGEMKVEVKISGPVWTRAQRVELYANGIKIREAEIVESEGARAGVKAVVSWSIARPGHDVVLTALAIGPGVRAPYWPCAKPYQRTSSHWTPYVLGISGAVFVDADGSGKFESAYKYARRVVEGGGTLEKILGETRDDDASVWAQVAGMLRVRGELKEAVERVKGMRDDSPVRVGVEAFAREWGERER